MCLYSKLIVYDKKGFFNQKTPVVALDFGSEKKVMVCQVIKQ